MRRRPWFLPVVLAAAAAIAVALASAATGPAEGAGDAEADELVVAASASARPFSVTVRGERLAVGDVESALDTGWKDLDEPPGRLPPAATCPGEAVACATGAAVAPPRGDAVTATAPGAAGPLESGPATLPSPLDGFLTLTGEPATATARDVPAARAEARSGTTTLDVTPARGVIGDLPALRSLLRGLGGLDAEGAGGRIAERLEGLVDDATGVAALRAEVGGSRAQTAASPPSATAEAGEATVVLAPLPGTDHGLVIVEVGPAQATVTAAVDQATAEAAPPEVNIRVFNPARGRYEDRTLSPGPATTCAGPDPVRVCVSGGQPSTIEGERRASATVSALTLTLFDDPLPPVVAELSGTEAHLVAAEAPAGVPDQVAIAAVLSFAAAGAIVAGILLARRRAASAPET